MPEAMLKMGKRLDKSLPKNYPDKSKKELVRIKWGILHKEFPKAK